MSYMILRSKPPRPEHHCDLPPVSRFTDGAIVMCLDRRNGDYCLRRWKKVTTGNPDIYQVSTWVRRRLPWPL